MYVDDLQVCCEGKDMRFIERQLQTAVNRMVTWCQENGFSFSREKTLCVHFCRRRGLHPNPEIFLDHSPIEVVESARFLGVTFDRKLTFLPHIKYLRKKCEKTLNLLKVLSNTSWGSDRTAMLRIYRAVVRSKLDYGSMAYGSASASSLRSLDTVHHSALRICCGAFRTSPVESLYVICSEPPLNLIRDQLSLQYYFRILSNTKHPLVKLIENTNLEILYNNRPSCTPPFGMRMRNIQRGSALEGTVVMHSPSYAFPPWEPPQISYERLVTGFPKSNTCNTVFRQLFAAHRDKHRNYTAIFTDGSKSVNAVGYAFVCGNEIVSRGLNLACSVFTAELSAICEAMTYIAKQPTRHFILYTDSLSSLQALESNNCSHPVVTDIQVLYGRLMRKGYSVRLCWIPSHVDIHGNEVADTAAKNPSDMVNNGLPLCDVKKAVKANIRTTWQHRWDLQANNKLHGIKDNLNFWPPVSPRKRDVILTRLRVGHCRLTHIHLLLGEPPLHCAYCKVPYTVSHILTSCKCFKSMYITYFNCPSPNLEDLIGENPHPRLFPFLHACGFYHEI